MKAAFFLLFLIAGCSQQKPPDHPWFLCDTATSLGKTYLVCQPVMPEDK